MSEKALSTVHGENTGVLAALEPQQVGELARARVEIESRLMLASMNPRNETAVASKLTANLERFTMADKAAYSYPRGRTEVRGPSVVLAREMARLWGNIDYGFKITHADEEYISLEARAIDYETGASTTASARFKKLIWRKDFKAPEGGRWIQPDERELAELVNRNAAKAIRNCVLAIMPQWLVEDALNQARKTVEKASSGDLKKDRGTVIRALAKQFSAYGVTVDMIEDYIGHDINAMSSDELADLREIRNTLRDGGSRTADFFDLNAGKPQKKAAKETPSIDMDGAEAGERVERKDEKKEAPKKKRRRPKNKEQEKEPEQKPEPEPEVNLPEPPPPEEPKEVSTQFIKDAIMKVLDEIGPDYTLEGVLEANDVDSLDEMSAADLAVTLAELKVLKHKQGEEGIDDEIDIGNPFD